ncbi:MAG: glycosyltransferase [Proteobacteria bacterium]|nr:glycosyltransferase [Pseudomonadota bacterium]
MITVICVYNREDIFKSYLAKSLASQSVAYEFICINNKEGKFSSAARALNYGVEQIKGDSRYIMFAHQDIELGAPSWLKEAEKMLDALPGFGIAGVAGKQDGKDILLTNTSDGIPPRKPGHEIREPVNAVTLDECCAIVPRTVFQRHRFDEALCRNWHLYVVEYCLRVIKTGLNVYILPLDLYHCSIGTLNLSYFRTLKKVMRAYGDRYPILYTTCGCWDTRASLLSLWFLPLLKSSFYAFTGRLIASGLVPAWLQRKRTKRLKANKQQNLSP